MFRVATLSMAFGMWLAISSAWAEDFGNAKEAEAMVKKAVAHIKSAGKDKAYAAFTAKAPDFINKDIYVVVYGFDGQVLAHGQNEKLVGRNLMEAIDAEGKPFVKQRIELARSKARFWQDYSFKDPITKSMLPKTSYCERMEETVVCAGIYKRT